MILKVIKRFPFFPIIFVINAVISFYFKNYYDSNINEMWLMLVLAILSLVVFWFIFSRFFQDYKKAAILIFVGSIFFYSFQEFIHLFRVWAQNSNNFELARFWYSNNGQVIILILSILLISIIFLLLMYANQIIPNTILLFNFISLSMFAFTLFNAFSTIPIFSTKNKLRDLKFSQYWDEQVNGIDVSAPPIFSKSRPDIYYIILDGFARSDVLNDLYGLNNETFIRTLRENGFYVADGSFANYSQTRTSLASSLNMMYLDEVAYEIGEDKSYYYPAYHMIENSLVKTTLSELGYETISFRSESPFTDLTNFDVSLGPDIPFGSYTQGFIRSTGVSVILNPLLFQWHVESIHYTLNKLPSLATREGPQFIFAHVLCPHPPFVFTTDGFMKPPDRLYMTLDMDGFYEIGSEEDYQRGYYDQVIYIQTLILELFNQIAENSSEPFIFIIQADHGPGMQSYQMNIENVNIFERLAILNSIYFYDQNYDQLYSHISPVNTFRVIFSQYLGITKPLLSDEHYYSKFTTLFNFVPVNDLLK